MAEATNEELDNILNKLSISLIEHSDFQKQRSVIKYFCGIMGYDDGKSRWKQLEKYTPILAAIQFCIHVFGLEASLPIDDRDDYIYGRDPTPLDRFRDYHSHWLAVGEANPLSWAHKLMVYGMHIARRSKADDKVRFSDDGSYYYFAGHGFLVKEWKAIVNDIIDNMECILSRRLLFRDEDTVEPMDPYQFIDDQRIYDYGHYFAELIPDYRHIAREKVLRSLMTSDEWRKMVSVEDDEIQFKAEGIMEYSRSISDFLETLILTIDWTCGQAGRGREMLSILTCILKQNTVYFQGLGSLLYGPLVVEIKINGLFLIWNNGLFLTCIRLSNYLFNKIIRLSPWSCRC